MSFREFVQCTSKRGARSCVGPVLVIVWRILLSWKLVSFPLPRGIVGMPSLRGRGLPASRLCYIPNFRAGSPEREGRCLREPRLDWTGACGSVALLMPPPALARRAGQSGTCLPHCASRSGYTAILDCTAQSDISVMVLPAGLPGQGVRASWLWQRGVAKFGVVPFASCVGTRCKTGGSAEPSRECFPL